jgi:hypothetical protein
LSAGPRFSSVFGVDFSGAKLAGQNIWIARAEPAAAAVPLRLMELHNLQVLAGTAEREPALAHLVEMIRRSTGALWGMDFPFGLPVEIFPAGATWRDQIRFVVDWKTGAYDFGLWCVGRARALGGPIHIRRTTDTETKTPFDCYHYRIIYQTWQSADHGSIRRHPRYGLEGRVYS